MKLLDRLSDPRVVLLVNEQPGRVAVQVPVLSPMLDDGEIERRVRLVPDGHRGEPLVKSDRERLAAVWLAELA